MKNKKNYFLYTFGSLTLGILLGLGVYHILYFITILVIFSIAIFIFIILNALGKKSKWKKYLTVIILYFLTLLICYLTTESLIIIYKMKAENAVQQIYAFKKSKNKYPENLSLVSISVDDYGYQVDSSKNGFEFYYWGIYGTTHKFTSQDSSWSLGH